MLVNKPVGNNQAKQPKQIDVTKLKDRKTIDSFQAVCDSKLLSLDIANEI